MSWCAKAKCCTAGFPVPNYGCHADYCFPNPCHLPELTFRAPHNSGPPPKPRRSLACTCAIDCCAPCSPPCRTIVNSFKPNHPYMSLAAPPNCLRFCLAECKCPEPTKLGLCPPSWSCRCGIGGNWEDCAALKTIPSFFSE